MADTVKNVLVMGCNGGFGEQFCRRFAADGARVSGIDLHSSATASNCVSDYVACDVVRPDERAAAFVAAADWIIIAIPEAPALAALRGTVSLAKRGALLADILSVKGQIVSTAISCVRDHEYLSLHPLFSPQEQFCGTVAVTPVRAASQASLLLRSLVTWGGTILEMTADDHDRAMAMVQVIAHAAILSFGAAGEEFARTSSPLATTPVHTMLSGLVRRITAGDPALYWDIQRTNVHAAGARERLARNLDEFRRAIDSGDVDAFTALFRRVSQATAHAPARSA